jgi:hypothetical protein
MIIAHYSHRLPAALDIGLIRARARERGPLWDAFPELYFKSFLLREQGRHGAIASSYSSLYLWRQDHAFRDFLVNGRYKVVTDGFGRAAIETRFALDARRGQGRDARFLIKDEMDIAPDADLTAVFACEIARNRQVAERSGVVFAAVGVDAQHWRLVRILMSEHEPLGSKEGTAYEILHLAKPLLETLPHGSG